jgi:hypothetical protein
MKKQRTIIAIVALLGVAGACPVAAVANPLLSGYGGPGQGNQAILGSALLNGPRGGSSGGPPSAGTSSAAVSGGGDGASSTGAGAQVPAGARHAHRAPAPLAPRQTTAGASDAAAIYAALERRASRPSETLGVTGQDLAYILLGLVVLTFAGLLTSRVVKAGDANARPG